MDELTNISSRTTPQTVQADPRQVANNAGGFTFAVTPEMRLRRFLTLGVEGGTYYVSAKDLAVENAAVVMDFAQNRTADLVREIVTISTAGRAPKQTPALFALAVAASHGDADGRRAALDALPLVARTGTALFQFTKYVEQFRGWGTSLRRGVASWYTSKSVDDLAYQVLKYQQREGVSHWDLLRLSHPQTTDEARKRLFDWIAIQHAGDNPRSPRHGKTVSLDGLRLVEGFQRARTAEVGAIPDLVREYRLSWEMLPSESLNSAAVWEALLDNGIPQGALLRQLPRLTNLGLLAPLGPWAKVVAAQLADPHRLTKARIHPINLLVALRTYASGKGARGNSTWSPSPPIVDALDAAFYAAFGAVQSTGLRHLLALDVSGSMATHNISNLPITPREASAALALVTAATEPQHQIIGFTSGSRHSYGSYERGGVLSQLSISPRQRLDDAIRAVSGLPFSGTDCSLPMLWALQNRVEVDVFTIYTDNETYAGQMHPHQALRQYRERINPRAKLVVCGMTASNFTIADPSDAGMLDIAGFDSATPNLLADFALQ